MGYLGRRPTGRLCCLALVAWIGSGLLAWGAPQSGAGTTTVADTVYRADGSAAQGTLIISWPAFVTAGGTAVAAGTTTTTLGANGALSVTLVPNAGANPAGMYYSVVYQLGPGQVKTEYWVVPATSPANLATVRMTPGAGAAEQPVSAQYVNSVLATKADKTYVDQAIANVGAGNFLATAGGTMTGPITLAAAPAAPMQASTKQYVDMGLAAKADVIAGTVPASELGTGAANTGSCLLGNGTSAAWGACGGGGGGGNLSTTPVASQSIAQPAGTQFSTNNLANIRYVTASWNWAQTPADNLATPGAATIHLSPCPLGIDTSANAYYTYKVYISGTGTAEAAKVTGGTCASGAGSGTIVVTTANAHAAGYTVGSASSGIQEAWNDAWVNDNGTAPNASSQVAPYVKLVSNQTYNVYASIYLRGRGGMLDGAGALIACSTRDRCIYIGTLQAKPYVNYHKLYNLSGTSTVNVDGARVANVSSSSGTYTVTTASNHSFMVGDTVDCEFNSQTLGQHVVVGVATVPSSTSFTFQLGSGTTAAGANTFGFCGLLNTFIEDNSDHVVVEDIHLFQSNPVGMGYFSYGIVNDNDQQFIIERATNRSSIVILNSANFPLGAFVYERTDQGNAGITYLHNSEFTGVNCATGGGNGMVVTDTVCQGFPVYGIRYMGGLQPGTFGNIYEESTGGTSNPLYGYAAQAGYVLSGTVHLPGSFPASGYAPTFQSASGGSAATVRNYFVIANSSGGYGPMYFAGQSNPNNSGGVNITVKWPSPQLLNMNNATFDLLVTTGTAPAPVGTGNYAVATGIAWGSACGSNGMCTFVDTQAAPASYTVPAVMYGPTYWFWPSTMTLNSSTVFVPQAQTNSYIVSNLGAKGVSVIADRCSSAGNAAQYSPIWVQCLASDSVGGSGTVATVLQQTDLAGNGPVANSKGRLNFGKPIVAPNDIITLQDSNFAKTTSTAGERPTNDAGDMALGGDQSGGLSERAATSISEYINAVPNGTNYQERLTGTAKTFNVPVTVNGNLSVTSGTVTLPVTGTGSQCLHASSSGVVTGTGADCGSGGSGSGTVNSGTASQVAMYSGTGAAVSGDTALTDNGTTLNYGGSGGITASTGTFSGNLTVNGQLMVAGPWMVSSPVPGTAMAAAGSGTSSLGLSSDGNFYISTNGGTPQKVATSATSSYFLNLWQEDPNTLGAYNGTTAQAMHVYGTYTNSSNFERTGLGWDPGNNYFVLRNENAGTGAQRGIGFWIGSGIRWGINTASELKPFSNNSFDIGDTAFAPRTVYAGTSIDTLTQGRLNFELCNDAGTGTALNLLAKYNGANPSCAVKAGTTDTDGVIGVVSNGSGTSANAVITYRGYVSCSFDNATTAGDYVTASGSTAGDCHDAGATRPSVQVIGRVESTNAAAGTYGVRVALESPAAQTSTLNWWITVPTGGGTTPALSSTAGKMKIFGVVLPYAVSTSQVSYYVQAADNSANTYDLGIYDSAGTLRAHIGSTAGTTVAPSAGWKTLSWVSATTLQPGRYLLAITSSCTSGCATFLGSNANGVTFQGSNVDVSVATGGVCPGSVSWPADSLNGATAIPVWQVH